MAWPHSVPWLGAATLAVLALGSSVRPLAGQAPAPDLLRVLPAGERPDDRRLGPLRDLDTHCPFTPPASREAWQARATALKRQLRVALGLWPWPARTPLHAVVTGTVDRDDYTVEKVVIESLPGHFVTGNVYRPKGGPARHAAVLTAHGHWPGGRFEDQREDAAARLASGAEPFEVSARFPMQARAVHLARLGVVTLLFDMVGYGDSVQIPRAIAHEFAASRPADPGPGWLFFSAKAELHLQSIMGLQAWNALRALDYLASRDDVDPARLGVTGESGGGTQTFILGALDERPAAIFPAVMVGTAMQGGCTCENASWLRVATNNVEIAALGAPRPLGMTAADDWTKAMETDGFPQLQQLYGLFDRQDQVGLFPFLRFPHNYNGPSRAAMYAWFNTWLHLGFDSVPPERPFEPLTRDEATVWTATHPAPASSPEEERRVTAWMTTQATGSLADALPPSAPSAGSREVLSGAWSVLLGDPIEGGDTVALDEVRRTPQPWGTLVAGIVRRASTGSASPALVLTPRRTPRAALVVVDPAGKSALFDASGRPAPFVAQALDGGAEVIGVDVLEQGEFRPGGAPLTQVRLTSPRAHLGYTDGYNAPLFTERVRDVLATIRLARSRVGPDAEVLLMGRGVAAGWAAGARAVARSEVDKAVYDVAGFRFGAVQRIDDPDLLPGAEKYGDMPALVGLTSILPTWTLDTVGTYRADDRRRNVSVTVSATPPPLGAQVEWLLRR